MVRIRLGNAAPLRSERDPDTDKVTLVPVEFDTPQLTEMEVHEPDLRSTLATVTALWNTHSAERPAWVAADNDVVAGLLAEHFGCQLGEPAPSRKGAK